MSLKQKEISTVEDNRISLESKAMLIYVSRLLQTIPSVDALKNIEHDISKHLLGETKDELRTG